MNTRQQDIVTMTQQCGEITIKELSAQLGVSEMTIHRDLDYLQSQRYLFKKRGAAVFIEGADRNTSGFYADQKRAIGKAAASLILPGQSILFDNSTTALECAKFLTEPMNLTFYTTSNEASNILSESTGNILYCSGGYYFPHSKGFVGQQVEDFVASIQADVCIIGASGISLAGGITTPYPPHTTLQKLIIQSSKECLLLADHSKFGKTAREKVADLSQIHTIITDKNISPDILNTYRKHVNIIIAEEMLSPK